MLAVGIGVFALIVLSALVRSGIAVAAAVLLTSEVALPGAVDALIWIVAGGYVALCVLGAFINLAVLLKPPSRF